MAGSWKKGLLFGAAAGLAGTAAMNGYWAAMAKAKPELGSSDDEPSTEKLARRALRQAGVKAPSKRTRAAGGTIVHWGYGTAWGAMAGLSKAAGVPLDWGYGQLLGLGLWAAGDVWMLYQLGLAKHPREYPASVHGAALGAHLAYGLGLWAALKGMDKMSGSSRDSWRRAA
jgi:hypothetical protein